MPPLLTAPRRVLVTGDWHRHIAWALAVVRLLPSLLPDESPRLILHAGDFGITSDWLGTRYLNRLNQALAEADAILWFADGNHEDFDQLYELAGDPSTVDPVQVHERIIWLPRGHRWSWHNLTWLALGGGVSVDRVKRTEQVDWWSDEEITPSQIKRVLAGGTADVMLCHDAPSSVRLRLPPPASWWSDRDLARADRHRERLQGIVDQVKPSYLMHGHYHLAHEQEVRMAHGPVRVTGFDRDEAPWGTTGFSMSRRWSSKSLCRNNLLHLSTCWNLRGRRRLPRARRHDAAGCVGAGLPLSAAPAAAERPLSAA